jgi:O-antigen ligase
VLKPELHSRIHVILSCFIAFFLPFKQIGAVQIVAIGIGLVLLNWLLEGRFVEKIRGIRYKLIFFVCIGFYLLHIVGLAWTNNIPSGLFDLEVKLSLLIFPLVYGTRPLGSEAFLKVMKSFLIGCASAALLILIRACWIWMRVHENKFFYEEFSYFMHPSYFSMYLNFGLLYLIIECSAKPGSINRAWLGLVPLFVLVIVLLSSKLGLISLLLIIVGWLCLMIVRSGRYILGLLSILVLGAGVFLLLKVSPEISGRIKNAVHALSDTQQPDKTNAESTAVRMLIWGVAGQAIAEHPLIGAGTGDAKDVLMEKYKTEGIAGAYAHNLNAHNEYLQVWVALGLLGFLFLIGMLLLPMQAARNDKKILLVFFVLLLALNFLPESMLETQAGVMFYAFFNTLLVFSAPEPEMLQSEGLKTAQ